MRVLLGSDRSVCADAFCNLDDRIRKSASAQPRAPPAVDRAPAIRRCNLQVECDKERGRASSAELSILCSIHPAPAAPPRRATSTPGQGQRPAGPYRMYCVPLTPPPISRHQTAAPNSSAHGEWWSIDASDDGDRRSDNPVEKRQSAAARLVQVAGQGVVLSRSRGRPGIGEGLEKGRRGIGSRISEIGG